MMWFTNVINWIKKYLLPLTQKMCVAYLKMFGYTITKNDIEIKNKYDVDVQKKTDKLNKTIKKVEVKTNVDKAKNGK